MTEESERDKVNYWFTQQPRPLPEGTKVAAGSITLRRELDGRLSIVRISEKGRVLWPRNTDAPQR